jgi:hypothetical protein
MGSMHSAPTYVAAGALVAALGLAAPVSAAGPTRVAAPASASSAVYVSVHGSDRNNGTADHPVRTIQAGIDRARAGGTVVVRPGRYHEGLTIAGKDDLTLRAAKRGTVWVDGTSRVGHWQRSGSAWVHPNWKHQFNASPTFSWNAPDNPNPNWSFVNPAHPMAAHPDQVFVDGHSLRQVRSQAAVRHGRFYVDYATDKLYVGTRPTGRDVRASTIVKAMSIQSAGVTVDGINVRGFAPSVPNMGAITVERPRVLLSHMLVRDVSTTGAFLMSTNDQLRHVTFRHNGLMGFMATHATGLRVDRVSAINNNTELFNQSPAAGGAKIGRTTDVRVTNSRFSHNHANGLWFDESSYRIQVIRSRMRDNSGHGISVEISGHALIAGNVIAGNGGNGIKINDTDSVDLWNNTFVGNARPIAVLQDNRDVNPGGSYHDPSLPLPFVIRHITVANNIVASPGAGSDCVLCVQDYTHRFTAEALDIHANGNAYQRSNARTPSRLVLWSRGSAAPALFSTIPDFRSATGQEVSHLALTGKRAVTRTFRPTAIVQRRAHQVAQPLPADIANACGRNPGARWLGAWFGA